MAVNSVNTKRQKHNQNSRTVTVTHTGFFNPQLAGYIKEGGRDHTSYFSATQ